MAKTATKELLTPGEVADWLGVTIQTLAAWRYKKHGGPDFTRFGRMIRYERSRVQAYIDAGRVEMAR
ncbi:helix-turn-helix domain-containing protein [Microbacterium sp.]|uniref:helix-turn-helix domain-containing protein n=1 Tax=Microbacterium sp. TaxID=51671 RepID=UPI003C73D74E